MPQTSAKLNSTSLSTILHINYHIFCVWYYYYVIYVCHFHLAPILLYSAMRFTDFVHCTLFRVIKSFWLVYFYHMISNCTHLYFTWNIVQSLLQVLSLFQSFKYNFRHNWKQLMQIKNGTAGPAILGQCWECSDHKAIQSRVPINYSRF
jgi:hypothetical protein